jgi:hypothetical protein
VILVIRVSLQALAIVLRGRGQPENNRPVDSRSATPMTAASAARSRGKTMGRNAAPARGPKPTWNGAPTLPSKRWHFIRSSTPSQSRASCSAPTTRRPQSCSPRDRRDGSWRPGSTESLSTIGERRQRPGVPWGSVPSIVRELRSRVSRANRSLFRGCAVNGHAPGAGLAEASAPSEAAAWRPRVAPARRVIAGRAAGGTTDRGG